MISVVKIAFIALVIFLTGCTHYSTILERTEEQNTISAPIDIVWQKTLGLLNNERIELDTFNESMYTIDAHNYGKQWSSDDEVTIKLHSRASDKTVIHIEVHPGIHTTLVGWGHQKRLAVYLFEKIKETSEDSRKRQDH